MAIPDATFCRPRPRIDRQALASLRKHHLCSVFFGQRLMGYPEIELLRAKRTRSRLGDNEKASGILQAEIVVHSLVEFLLATKILLRRLNRCMPKQKLNLLKLTAS